MRKNRPNLSGVAAQACSDAASTDRHAGASVPVAVDTSLTVAEKRELALQQLVDLHAVRLDCLRRFFKGDTLKMNAFAQRVGIALGVH